MAYGFPLWTAIYCGGDFEEVAKRGFRIETYVVNAFPDLVGSVWRMKHC